MKFLVLFSACVAAASASLVTHANGAVTPVETPSVQAAKAAHFAAKGAYAYAPYAAAYGYNGYAAGYGYNGLYNGAYAAPYNYGYNYAAPYNYGYNYGGLVAHANGAIVPVDEPAVQAAKAEHFAAKGLPVAPVAAGVYAGYAGAYAAPFAYAPAYHGLVAHANGAIVPVDEPAVAAARAEHLAHF